MTDEATKDLMTSLITACLENEVQSDTSDKSSNSDFVLSRAATIVWMIEREEQELELPSKERNFCELLMRKFELSKRIRSKYRFSDGRMVTSGEEIGSDYYLVVGYLFYLVGLHQEDLRYHNTSLKIFGRKCVNQSQARHICDSMLQNLKVSL